MPRDLDVPIRSELDRLDEALQDLHVRLLGRLRGEWPDEYKSDVRVALSQMLDLQITIARLR